jgi:hypothetical protein
LVIAADFRTLVPVAAWELQQIAIERRAKVEEFQCKHRVGREQGSCLYNQQRLKCMIKVAEVKSRAVTISVSLLVGETTTQLAS